MNNEEWRDIPGYEGRYQVSNMGRIKSMARIVPRASRTGNIRLLGVKEKILSPRPIPSGHLTVRLYAADPKNDRTCYVHRLVLEVFVGPCPANMECCHDPDPEPSNNRLDNLRWGTRQDNVKDMYRHGTRKGWRPSEETRQRLREAWKLRKIRKNNENIHD